MRSIFLKITIGIIAASLLIIAVALSFIFYDLITLTPERALAFEQIYGQAYEGLEIDEIVKVGSLVVLTLGVFLLAIVALIRTQIVNEKLKLERIKLEKWPVQVKHKRK